MKNKKMILGLAVIIIAGAIFIVSEKLNTVRPPDHKTKFFPKLEERHITGIAIKEKGAAASTRIEKRDGVWTVGNVGASITEDTVESAAGDEFFPANETLVQIALEKIISLRKNELISENPANQAAYEVDIESAPASIEIFTAGGSAPEYTLIIGKSGPNWGGNYIRLTNDNAVYLASGGLRQSMFLNIENWKKTEPVLEPESTLDLKPGPENNEDGIIGG